MTTKLIVITDAHANLPALTAALDAADQEGYDAIIHTGDAIAIGPYPAEVLDRLLTTPHLECLMGNHDAWFVDGLPQPQPPWMSDAEVEHQHWTHQALDPARRAQVAAWPYRITRDLEGVRVTFLHYAVQPTGRGFTSIIRQPTAADLDQLFAPYESRVVFYGHHHPQSDIQGRARYVNPGALGCCDRPLARYAVATFHAGQCTIEHRAVPYDDTPLRAAFEARNVPDRAFLYRLCFGGRFP